MCGNPECGEKVRFEIENEPALGHIGYIVDRTGFEEFKKWALDGVTLSDKAILKNNIYWSGIKYPNT